MDTVIFFSHRKCVYYPCHQADFALNCVFCFCPLYSKPSCPGQPRYLASGIKDCSACAFPHQKDNYHLLIAELTKHSLV